MPESEKPFVPALGYHWLTRLYDPVIRWGMRELPIKRALIEQAGIGPGPAHPRPRLRLTDRPGALGRTTRKLAEHNINIDYTYGSIEKGSPKALVVMAFSDLKRAAKLLK